MKKVIAIAILALSAITASAQSLDKEQFYVGAIVQRRNIDTVRDLRPNTLNDSIGVTFEYAHFLGKGKGRVGFGVDYAILFHANQPNGSKVAQQAGHFTVTVQNRDAKRFQPFIKGGIGVARDAFGGVVFSNDRLVGPDATRSIIAGGGIDTVLKGRLKWRIGAEYQNTAFGGSQQHNVRVTSGLVF
jgi:hypothetical protein